MRGQRAVFLLRALDAHAGDGFMTLVFARAGEPWRGAALEKLREIAAAPARRADRGRRRSPTSSVDGALALAEALRGALADAVVETAARAGRPAPDRGRAALHRARAAHRRGARGGRATAARRRRSTATSPRWPRPCARASRCSSSASAGAGGSRACARAAALLADDGWMTFEAGAAEINAGMTYVGELEGRMRHLVRTLDGERVLWIAPAFEALLYAGVTRQNPQGGALDLLLAGMADARVHVAGILAPGAVRAADPRAAGAARRVRRRARGADGRAAHARAGGAQAAPGTDPAVLREALALGRHFLGDAALPGALLVAAGDDAPPPAGRRPADDGRRARRRSPSARAFRPRCWTSASGSTSTRCGRSSTSRVIGQPEAVECMVERVALLKAGLTDPTRPQAVLLFVGPTGTGKTEIAKALAEYLFGSRRPDDPARHERVPEPGLRAADARGRRARRRVAGRPDPPPAVLRRAARRVREGRAGRLRPLPAGLRRRPPERPARRGRGLPPRRDHHDLEPGREGRHRRARVLAGHRVRARRASRRR